MGSLALNMALNASGALPTRNPPDVNPLRYFF
jgi:hypothetical protein